MSISTVPQTAEIYAAAIDSIGLDVYSAGSLVSVSGISFKLFGPGETTERRSGTGATASTGKITAATTATDFPDEEEDARCEFTYTAAGETVVTNVLFDVVSYKVLSPITSARAQQYFPQLADHKWAGTTSWETQIQLAWSEVKADLRAKGINPRRIPDSSQIERLVVYKALELIFWAFPRQRDGSIWRQFYEDCGARYQKALDSTPIPVDTDGDGNVDGVARFGSVRLMR